MGLGAHKSVHPIKISWRRPCALRKYEYGVGMVNVGGIATCSWSSSEPAIIGNARCMTARDRLRAWDVNFLGSSNLTHKSCGIFVASWGFAHCIGRGRCLINDPLSLKRHSSESNRPTSFLFDFYERSNIFLRKSTSALCKFPLIWL